jgi:DNA polymerase-3 subunit alpha
MRFVHLHLHSHYSLLDGLSKIDEIVARAKELGMEAVALTDHGNLYGAIEFYQKATKEGIKPIIGCELYVAPRSRFDKEPGRDAEYFHLPVLARNNTGYQNLLQLVTKANLEGFYYKPRVDKELLREFHEGLIALSGCLSGEIPRAILSGAMDRARALVTEYIGIFGKEHFVLELQHHPEFAEQRRVNDVLKEFSSEFNLPLVVTADAHYPKQEDKEAHDVLLAIQTGAKVDDAERMTMKDADFHIKSAEEIAKDFSDTPEAIAYTATLAEQCNVELSFGHPILPKFNVPEGKTSLEYLRERAEEGLARRFAEITPAIRQRFDYELSVIEKTGFADYFLIVSDFINWAKDHNIVVGPGRGSVAGSLVAYALRITEIDPLAYGLLFERFLNPERPSMPDIDVDFQDDRRDEVIRYVTEKYGADHVAQICTFGVMKARLAVRDVARALGFPYALGDQISKLIPFNVTIDEALEASQELRDLAETNPDANTVLETARKLEGVVRHASTHAAGVVISRDPLVRYVPLQHTVRGDTALMTQYEMHAVEALGLLKIDFLGLANLTVIKNCVRIIKKIADPDFDITKIPMDDRETYGLLGRGETVGVFQFESQGMTNYLKELKPSSIYDLMAMVALYRPGPMELIPDYIAAKHGKKKPHYLHPSLEPILRETYGIMVYQEQVQQVAQEFAGYTLGEGYLLVKAIAKKIKSEIENHRARFIEKAVQRGRDRKTAEALFGLIEPFARYGFNRAHSAAYAYIAYQTAYLKAHHPSAFMAALLTSDYGNLDRIAIEIAECNRLGIAIVPPSVNKSFVEFGVVPETGEIIFSLAAIKGIGVGAAATIQEERQARGTFTSLENFIERMPRNLINKKTLECLIKSGALDEFGERRQMLEGINDMLRYADHVHRQKHSSQSSLFGDGGSSGGGLSLKLPNVEAATRAERLRWEKEFLGFYLSDHPLAGYLPALAKLSTPLQKISGLMAGKRLTIGGMIASAKRIVTKTGKPMLFSEIEDRSAKIEVVVFPDILEQNPMLWRVDNVLLVHGRVDTRNGVLKFICERAEEIRE